MKKMLSVLSLVAIVAMLVTACDGGAEEKTVTVSSKNFTEQYILGWMTVLILEDAGFTVNNQVDLGGTSVNREALENGDVDMYWEYTGTAWLVHLGHENAITDPAEAFDMVKAEDAENGLVWLDYAPFNNTYTLMMTEEEAAEYGISTISDLGGYLEQNPDAVLCSDEEWTVRPDGYPALQELYGFSFPEENVRVMEIGVTYLALRDGECNVAMGFATDGRIAAWGLINLEDDQQFFPVYNPAPVVRESVLDEYPELDGLLDPLAAALDTETMTSLNALVDVGEDLELDSGDEMEPEEVACDFLLANDLVEDCGE
jgi:osmoprotectant transport system substrate-binding protein